MNRHHEIALHNPCLLAEETTLPMYSYFIPTGSIVLTVNSGYE